MTGKKKSFLHDILLPNLGIKLLSLLGAIVVWLMIINIDDPYKTKTFQVHVETVNESALTSVNKVFEITSGEIASVRVTGKRSVVDKLDATDIQATADLSNLSSVNAVTIRPSLRKKVSSEVSLECSDVLKVSLENMASKQLKVTIVTEGTPADGYTIGSCTAKPNMIQVSGGESAISRITAVKVFLNVDAASEDFSSRLDPVAYDDNDHKVSSSTLTFSDAKIKVRARVLQTKTIPVRVEISGEPAEGYEYIETECLPTEIEVAGTKRKLTSISELVIPIDITGLTASSAELEQTIDVIDYLKTDGIIVSEEYESISIKILLEAQITRQMEILVENIQFRNLGKGLIADIPGEQRSVLVTLAGKSSVLNALSPSALVAYVDCKDKSEGSYQLPLQMDLAKGCTLTEAPELTVRIASGRNQEALEQADPSATAQISASPAAPSPTTPVSEPPKATEISE